MVDNEGVKNGMGGGAEPEGERERERETGMDGAEPDRG